MADLKCLVPISLNDNDFLYSDVPETDHSVWNSGTTYALGDRVIRTTTATHKIYESLQNSNLNKTPESQPTWWIEVSATNRWKSLDGSLFQSTTHTATMRYFWELPSAINTVALHAVEGGSVFVGLIETSSPGARRNLMTFSEVYDLYTLSNVAFNPTLQATPWGAYSGQGVRENSATSTHYVEGGAVSYTSGLNYTLSIYVKRGVGTRNCRIELPSAAFGAGVFANFDLGTGVVNATGGAVTTTSTDEGTGWYRISVRAAATATAVGFAGRLYLASGTTISYTGDNSSSISMIGWQMEQANSPSTYQVIFTALIYGERTYTSAKAINVAGSNDRTDAVFLDIPGSVNDVLEIAVYADSGVAQLGEQSIGNVYTVGEIVNFGRGTQRNLSRKEFDPDFGTLTIVPRAGRKERTFNIMINRDSMNSVDRFLASVEATKCSYFTDGDTSNLWGLLVYGVLQDWTFEIPSHETVIFPLTIDGIV